MMKVGVVSRGAFADMALQRERERRGWWPFAYTLLGELGDDYSEKDDALLERLYRSMRAGDGVYKITRSARFTELDDLLHTEIRRRFPVGDLVQVHDMAASNAITSLELFDRLADLDNVRVHASDYFDALHVASFADTPWRVVLDVDFKPLQWVGRRFVLSAFRPEPWRFPLNRIVQSTVRARLLPRVDTAALARGERPGGIELNRIELFHPRCARRASQDARFTLGRDNLFAPSPRPAQVVRVMNALTTRHFSEPQVMQGLRAVARNVTDGGLLALGRNVDEADGHLRATVFEKRADRLRAVTDVAGGYELRQQALEIVDLG